LISDLSLGGFISRSAVSMVTPLKLSSSLGKLLSSQLGVSLTGCCCCCELRAKAAERASRNAPSPPPPGCRQRSVSSRPPPATAHLTHWRTHTHTTLIYAVHNAGPCALSPARQTSRTFMLRARQNLKLLYPSQDCKKNGRRREADGNFYHL